MRMALIGRISKDRGGGDSWAVPVIDRLMDSLQDALIQDAFSL